MMGLLLACQPSTTASSPRTSHELFRPTATKVRVRALGITPRGEFSLHVLYSYNALQNTSILYVLKFVFLSILRAQVYRSKVLSRSDLYPYMYAALAFSRIQQLFTVLESTTINYYNTTLLVYQVLLTVILRSSATTQVSSLSSNIIVAALTAAYSTWTVLPASVRSILQLLVTCVIV